MEKVPTTLRNNLILLFFFVPAAYFTIFFKLGRLDICMWDESRLAVNTLEMYYHHNLLLTTFNGSPDLWGTKPPLMIWAQLFFFRILGPSVLALRLPSALSALAISLLLAGVVYRKTSKLTAGLLSALVFVTSAGFIGLHVSRTGDYDALLSLFIFLYCFSFYFYVTGRDSKKRKRDIYLTFLFLTLATLTKGIQAIIPLPALLLFILLEKQLKDLLRTASFYIGSAFFILVIAGYYLLREHAAPGYLRAVSHMELASRYLHTIEEHSNPFYYYFHGLIHDKFNSGYLFLILSLPLSFLHPDKGFRSLLKFSLLAGFFYLLVLSFSKTKCEWYDAPFYPFAALMAGITLAFLFEWLIGKFKPLQAPVFIRFVLPLALLLLFVPAFSKITKDNMHVNFDYWKDVQYGKYLRHLENDLKTLPDTVTFVHGGYNAPLTYYKILYNHEKGKDFSIWNGVDTAKVKANAIFISCQDNQKEILEHQYKTQLLNADMGFWTLRVLGRK